MPWGGGRSSGVPRSPRARERASRARRRRDRDGGCRSSRAEREHVPRRQATTARSGHDVEATRSVATASTAGCADGTRPAATNDPSPGAAAAAPSHPAPSAANPAPSTSQGSTHPGIRGHARMPTANAAAADGSIHGPTPCPYTVTWSRISSSVAGPIPLTSIRSSTDANGPFCSRYSTIVAARTSPMPESVSSSVADAELMLRRPPATPGAPPGGGAARGARLRHEDLRPVGERRREVQQAQVRLRQRPAGPLDRVDHAVALDELVDAGLTDRAGDVHDQHDRRARRRGRLARRPDSARAIVTGLGSERAYHSPAPPSTATRTTIRPAISPRDSVSRRSRSDMRRTLGPRRSPAAVSHVTPLGSPRPARPRGHSETKSRRRRC